MSCRGQPLSVRLAVLCCGSDVCCLFRHMVACTENLIEYSIQKHSWGANTPSTGVAHIVHKQGKSECMPCMCTTPTKHAIVQVCLYSYSMTLLKYCAHITSAVRRYQVNQQF